MGIMEETISLSAPPEKMLKIASNYEIYPELLPGKILNVKILTKESDLTTIEEEIFLGTKFKQTITQQSIHKQTDSTLYSKIISGPAKGSEVTVSFVPSNDNTLITVKLNLHVSLKYKLLEPIIKKWYKRVLTGILYRINSLALEDSQEEKI